MFKITMEEHCESGKPLMKLKSDQWTQPGNFFWGTGNVDQADSTK